MNDQRITKNKAVCKKNPVGVGQPPSLAILTQPPKNFCRSLYVSGFAIKKKIRVVYAAYFALSAMLGPATYTPFRGFASSGGDGIYLVGRIHSSSEESQYNSFKHTKYKNITPPKGMPPLSSNTFRSFSSKTTS